MRKEVLISGFGGQGVVLSSGVLAQALMYRGYEVAATYSYGAAARLGVTRGEVIISDDWIDYPKVKRPDFWIVMNQASLNVLSKKYDIEQAVVLADSSMISFLDPIIGRAKEIFRIPASDLAEELGAKVSANMLMLGALLKVSGLSPLEDLERSIRELVKPEFIDVDIEAAKKGYELIEKEYVINQ